MPEHELNTPEVNPAEILGVSAEAGEEQIRAAYLQKVKQFPPDRFPAEFESVRAAYDSLRDPRRRARMMLGADNVMAPLARLVQEETSTARRFAGPAPWLAALKEQLPLIR